MNKEKQEEVGEGGSLLGRGGEREAGQVRTLAPHHPFFHGKRLLAPPCNIGCGRDLPLRGPLPNIISNSSHRMAFVFPDVTSKRKHTGRISGEGRRWGKREEEGIQIQKSLSPQPARVGTSHLQLSPSPELHKIGPSLLFYRAEN